MKVFLAAVIFVGVAVLLLGVNIFFFHRPFPNGEISTNPEMQKRGIKCARQEELERLAREGGRSCSGEYSEACKTCTLYVLPGSGQAQSVKPGSGQASQNK